MNQLYPKSLRVLVNELCKLPSVGEKSALRLAYHLITSKNQDALKLAKALEEASHNLKLCKQCFFITDHELCGICSNTARNQHTICVVEKPADVFAVEKGNYFQGLYHVLHGLWSPMRGILPEQIRIPELLERVQKHSTNEATKIHEIVIATGTTIEGDATAMYISQRLQELDVKVSRIAQGMPKGGELEYADQMTLSHAFDGRKFLS